MKFKIRGENIKEEKTMRNTKWTAKIIPNPRQEREYIERDNKQKNDEKTKKLKKSKTEKQNFENTLFKGDNDREGNKRIFESKT